MKPQVRSPQALQCRACVQQYPVEQLTICEEGFGPRGPAYDVQSIDGDVFRKQAEAGPRTLWRYESLLPGGPGIERVDLGAGFTPLRRADNLAKRLGLRTLWIKDDSVNPSNSFKDRVVSVAVTMARAFGFEAVSCASTGNLANATAAHAALAGIPAYVFVPDDLEGAKTLGFEAAEQLGWRLPDHVVVPIASGALLTKVHRAFRELIAIGAVEEKPYRVSGAQAEGCSPVAQAFAAGAEDVRPVKPDTIARALAIGAPTDGFYALQTSRATNGEIDACAEEEIVEGIRLLAETEGVFTETAGGVTIAVLKSLVERGAISPEEETVAFVTGNGYKTIEALEPHISPTFHVEPDLEEFLDALGPSLRAG